MTEALSLPCGLHHSGAHPCTPRPGPKPKGPGSFCPGEIAWEAAHSRLAPACHSPNGTFREATPSAALVLSAPKIGSLHTTESLAHSRCSINSCSMTEPETRWLQSSRPAQLSTWQRETRVSPSREEPCLPGRGQPARPRPCPGLPVQTPREQTPVLDGFPRQLCREDPERCLQARRQPGTLCGHTTCPQHSALAPCSVWTSYPP